MRWSTVNGGGMSFSDISKIVVALELVPCFIQGAEYSATDHTLFRGSVLWNLQGVNISKSGFARGYADLPCQDEPSQWLSCS
jgi:hypothetical protein